jgi:DNA polymerase III delta prime subunit
MELTNELDSIYGIEENKWEILNYIKYLEISKEKHFANYNIIIHTRSSYPLETKIKLIEFLHTILKQHNIINSEYEFVTSEQLKLFKKNDKSNNKEDINLNEDLIIIDSEKIGRSLENYKEEIMLMMEKFKDKIFIIIDDSFCKGEINAIFSKYYDWFFEIDKISENNKRDYIEKILNKNNIKIKNKCEYIEKLVEEPFFIVKSKINHVILQCKLNDVDKITDKFVKKYLEDSKEEKLKKTEKNKEENNNENLNLDSLVGICNIKGEINKIVNYVKICKKRKGTMPMLHMCFTGNPGTGKTTVARIIGKVFKDEKILSTGEFVEIHGRDLVGKYVGWTADEVKKCVNSAKGGILFIDEAYSLNSDRRGSFEDEAIATLIKEMEDNRDDLCVIFAGYQKEMKELLKRNPGFESRIQFYLNFPNYNEEELYEIFRNLAKKENYKISSQVKELLQNNFRKINTNETFSNGRYVRNLYEKVKIEQANRVSLNENEDINLIKKCDIESGLESVKSIEVQKNKIGFLA